MAAIGCALVFASVVFAMVHDVKYGLMALLVEGFIFSITVWLALRVLKKSHIVLDADSEKEG